jgi:hypothetical protein
VSCFETFFSIPKDVSNIRPLGSYKPFTLLLWDRADCLSSMAASSVPAFTPTPEILTFVSQMKYS